MTDLARRLAVARGDEPADVVITGGSVLSVFTREWLRADVAIADGWIAGVGDYEGRETIDATGMWVAPGLIDAHVHIESSRLLPDEFARLLLPHGTTTVVADPHEIANVLGTDGVHWLLDATEGLPLDVFFMASSCVPASIFESPRRALTPGDLEGLLRRRRVLGLAEMMNFPGVIGGADAELEKLGLAGAGHVDGHAPGVLGPALQAYAAAGIRSDHEATTLEEGRAAAARRDVGADPRGVGRAQPGRPPAPRGRVRAAPAGVLHRRPRPRPHRLGGPPERDGARRGRGRRRSGRRARDGDPRPGHVARPRRPRRRRTGLPGRPPAPPRPARVPPGRGAEGRPPGRRLPGRDRARLGAQHGARQGPHERRPARRLGRRRRHARDRRAPRPDRHRGASRAAARGRRRRPAPTPTATWSRSPSSSAISAPAGSASGSSAASACAAGRSPRPSPTTRTTSSSRAWTTTTWCGPPAGSASSAAAWWRCTTAASAPSWRCPSRG